MKGALYVLGSKATQNLAILDWRFGPRYLHWILQCSHQERPSVQNLIKTITHDFIIRIAEPSTLKATVESEDLNRSAQELETMISVGKDEALLAKVSAKSQQRIEQKNKAYDELVSTLPLFTVRVRSLSWFRIAPTTLIGSSRPFDSLAVQSSRNSSPSSLDSS